MVPPGREIETLEQLRKQKEIAYAELDFLLTRQFVPNDPQIGEQWHHGTIHSSEAWSISLATHKVTLAILDTPFQMNHPDLIGNTVAGWSMIGQAAITGDPIGYYHSTIGAGVAAAAINNLTGASGVANCWLMPIDIGDNPTTSDMHAAVVWAADHGVRVVNLSWDGAFSSVINEAGAYLKEKVGGMLFMSGVNGRMPLDYENQPDIYAISMTDQNDEPRSAFGDHIDFAAPGWEIYSTTTNSTYEVDSGTSYSAPLAAGIVAWVMSVNTNLGPAEIEEILRKSAVDLGEPGWDQTFGWGRIDFGSVATNTFETLPARRITVARENGLTVKATAVPGASYRLWRSVDLGGVWEPIGTAGLDSNLRDPSPPSRAALYKVEITLPRD
jgi:thermitase